MKSGDIILVPFPFTDFSQVKLRPAVVVTTVDDGFDDVVVCLISSNIPDAPNVREVVVDPSAENNLRAQSVIKVYRLATVHRPVIAAQIGNLSPKDYQRFANAFSTLLQP